MVEFVEKQRYKRGQNPNSLKNLKPFQNGKSGNPNGRPPKDVSLTSLLKEEIDKVCPSDKQGRTWRQLLVLAWLTGAMKNPVLLKELLDRLEGKVAQPITGAGGGPIEVEHDAKGKLLSLLNSMSARTAETESDTKPQPKGS